MNNFTWRIESTLRFSIVLGVLLKNVNSNSAVLSGVLRAAQECGYSCMVRTSLDDLEEERKNAATLCASHVDAVLWEPVSSESPASQQLFDEAGIPVCILGTNHPDAVHLPYEEIGYQMTKCMVERKHRKIACLLTHELWTEDFLRGYHRCLFDHQIPLDESMVFYALDEALLYAIHNHSITGVLISDSTTALEFYRQMEMLHYRIPKDVSFITLRNECQRLPALPRMSTCTVRRMEFGFRVCRRLIQQIEKQTLEDTPFTQEILLDNTSTVAVCENTDQRRIVVVGSINIDTYLDVVQLPQSGMTASTSTSTIYPGGKGINQSIGASKLGAQVAIIGNVGSDLEAANIYNVLSTYSIDASAVRRCADVATGQAYIFVDRGGNSIISILAGANSQLSPAQIRESEAVFRNCGYCLIQSEIPMPAVLEACRMAHRHGAKTILKPSACEHLSQEVLREVDIIVPNENELRTLCPQCATLEERAASLRADGVGTVITTLGASGSYVQSAEMDRYFPASVFRTVDNTGASDAFISALAAYLLQDYDLERSVRIATCAAGFAISREGVVPALIDRSSLESYIRQTDPGLLQ